MGSHGRKVKDEALEAEVRPGLQEIVKRKNNPLVKAVEVEMALEETKEDSKEEKASMQLLFMVVE